MGSEGRVDGVSPSLIGMARIALWLVHGTMIAVAIFAIIRRPVPLVGWEFENPVLLVLGLVFVGAPVATFLVKGIFAAIFGTAAHAMSLRRSSPSSDRERSSGDGADARSRATEASTRLSGVEPGPVRLKPVTYGFLEADTEVELVRAEEFRVGLGKLMDVDLIGRSRLEGWARLRPTVGSFPGERDGQGRLVTRVVVEFEGVELGYLPDDVALASARNLRRFIAETQLDVFCPIRIVAGSSSNGGPVSLPKVSVGMDARRSHQVEVRLRREFSPQ